MFFSIRARIGVLYILLILALMLGLTYYLSQFIENNSKSQLFLRLEDEARIISNLMLAELQSGSSAAEIDKLTKRLGASTQIRLTIIDNDGVVVGESSQDPAELDNHAGRPEVIQAHLHGIGRSTRFSDTMDYEMLYVAVPIKDGDQSYGVARVSYSLQAVEKTTRQLQRTLIIATLFMTTLAMILAAWISNRTTRPLRDLILAANQMAAGKLDSRLIPTTQDEIGNLTQTFNEMAAQLNAKIEDLEGERSRIAAVLSVMTDGVIIVNEQNRVELINPSANSLFEIEEQEALGKSLFEVVRHHQIEEIMSSCRTTGESQSTSMEISTRRIYLQATATPLGYAQPGKTLLLFQNLTRVRKLETIRQDFISNISHELRTPLAALRAITETLYDGALEDPPAARRFLTRMETELDALSQMVEELLELSRIESGRVPLRKVPASPHDMIQSAVERLRLQAERSGLTVEVDCPPDLPKVLADPPRLVQVIVNLLHNAIKFTPTGGKILISAQQQRRSILFSAKDTGVGIPLSDLSRIFERFYKTDRSRSGGGTGLGLAIARHLVEAHEGAIWVESLENVGSTFYFTIPLAD